MTTTPSPASTATKASEALAVSTAAVELAEVVKRFEDVTAVERLDLRVPDGEFFSLLGPSGCGKTTTLRMIAGLEIPTEGSVRIFGEEMGLRPPNRRPVNTVFQSYALFPHMTVEQNIAFGLQMRRTAADETRRRVAEVIELVRLGGMERRKPQQLSGGQQQRVALGRALVNQPKVLLLDEPLGALDLKLRQAMQLELKELQERVGVTFVYVTHDQEEALTMSDRIGVMDAGRLLQVGTPEEIYEHPRTRMVADFIGQTNFLAAVAQGQGEARLADGRTVNVPPGSTSGVAITLALRPEKLSVVPAGEPSPSGANQLVGVVERRVYLGSSLTYEVALEGVTLRVRQENTPSVAQCREGDRVGIRWDPASTTVLEE